jgi:hypothetical protein
MTLPTRLLSLALLLGTVLLGIGALMHPALSGDAAAQLRIIAATPYWRAIHLVMLAGAGLVIAGIWVRLVFERSEARQALLAALVIVTVGEAINALNIAYMAGAGTHLAQQFQAGDQAATSLYDATHSFGLMAARFGNYLVALGALALGWAEWRDASSPRLFAVLAWLAAAAGVVGALLFHEASRFTLGAIAMLSAWQLATGVWALAGARAGSMAR